MKKLAIILIVAAALSALAAHPAINGWEQMGLQGRVRFVTITTGEGEFQYTETISFDEEGYYSHIFILDMGYVFADDDFGYEYDEAGRVVTITRPTNEDQQIENFIYDEEGRLFLSIKSSEGAGLLFTERTFWDLKGRKILGTIHEWNDLVWVESYSYDEQGRIIQSLRPASHYSRLGYSTHTYDEKGNPLLTREWQESEDEFIQTRFEYQFDPLGNILGSLKFIDYGDGEGEILEEITRYEYEYYPDE